MKCETCMANKVCNHDIYGFESCNNYIHNREAEIKELKCIIDDLTMGQTDLKTERDELLYENRHLRDRISHLTGNVEAYEFCIKNGACRK